MSTASASEASNPRLALRVLAFLLSVIGIAIYTSAYHNGAWIYDIIFAIPALYSLINAILILIKRPIHPGFHVALDLIFAAALLFFGILGIIGYSEYTYYYDVKNRAIATLAIMVITGLIHFSHFVLACCDVHLRRHSGYSARYNPKNEIV
ncbi:hypothetical protein N7448_004310 [Penicillium atrosanguineum]|uniref:MARVEL domain-containing protein n=1 Tax=Penicillium atrosanguineum TaxID=1132637 RepID=A0A9W9H8Z8_9EURO|nr:uncharacterized protein N7443_003274 [Penicillium atrosanguineum]KAJ5118043.1 hypothetical protein N7526_011066 [Penicillium atrosanguineum]KAJ5140902.1 hypothetical protein N7448_004310 [Penicillium atrosanguineum]KAJ5310813.1 hypothetical protein N7443_003274 [Penicillium atrosanguineum]KAJ5316338.1 hypothetical protein N7476_006645 [Penicillium atrosanguineum]